MRSRQLPLGDRNIVGERVTARRLELGMKQTELLAKLQTRGVSISTPALSLLEGMKRPVSDIEPVSYTHLLAAATTTSSS